MRRLALISSLLAPLAACHWLLPLDQTVRPDRANGGDTLRPGEPSPDRLVTPDLRRAGEPSRDLPVKPDRRVDTLAVNPDKQPADVKPTPDQHTCPPNEVLKGGQCVCPGCREISGKCQPGTAVAGCGTGGGPCEDCSQNPCLQNPSCTAIGCVGASVTGSSCPSGTCVGSLCCTGCVTLTGECQLTPTATQCGCGGTLCQDCTKGIGAGCGPGNCLDITCI